MAMSIPVSACIMCKNEASKIALALDSVRRVYMPKMPQAKFTARWAGFIQWEMEHDRKGIHFLDGKHIMPGDKITPKQAKRLADDVLREQSENGVKAPMSTMDEFKKWDAESSAIERKKKAAKAGHAKWDKEKQNK